MIDQNTPPLEELRQQAREAVSSYPELVTDFDEFVMVRSLRRIKTGEGRQRRIAIEKGEVTIAEKSGVGGGRYVWCPRVKRTLSLGITIVEDLSDEAV